MDYMDPMSSVPQKADKLNISLYQISRLHGQKIDDLNPILSKITRPVAAIKSLRFALLYWKQKLAC